MYLPKKEYLPIETQLEMLEPLLHSLRHQFRVVKIWMKPQGQRVKGPLHHLPLLVQVNITGMNWLSCKL